MKKTTFALLTLLALLLATAAGAAVRGDTRTNQTPAVTNEGSGLWSALPPELDAAALNTQGDLYGDGTPHLAQAPDGSWWAVWSLVDRKEQDIAISSFNGVSWSAPELVVEGNRRPDLDPRIGFLSDGTPVVIWWQKGTREDRTAHVMGSTLSRLGWSAPEILSPADVPAWKPGIRIDGLDIFVAFDTPGGIIIEWFTFDLEPDGGSDDLEIKGGSDGPSPFPGRKPRGGDEDDDDSEDDIPSIPITPAP